MASYGKGDTSKYNIAESSPSVVKFNTPNAQDDGYNKLKRIEFEFMGTYYKFALNPEEYSQPEPSKATMTQTKAGAWIDDFGAGVPTISFRGTTGWKHGGGVATTGTVTGGKGNLGFERFKELRDLIRQYYSKLPPGQEVTSKYELIFHNYTDGEHWVVHPQTFNLMRSVARPLLYLYDIQLICLRPAHIPSSKGSGNVGKLGKLRKTSR